MFQKAFGFRRKSSDDSREPGSRGRFSRSHSRQSSPSRFSAPTQEDDARTPSPSLRIPDIPTVPGHFTRKNSGTDSGPLGLNIIFTPENRQKVDIVFIHGLGGTSKWTWSKYRNPELFWPLTFLPLEPDICSARILSFGYNANILRSGSIGTSVLDFAKDLLFDLKYAKDEQKEDLCMGNVPLIFVVHSMGGLIVKEAYIQGQNDPKYESIIKAVSAITFLATPHRGTNLAATLNRILQSTVIANAKQYISDLARNSFQLQKLNEQFRHIAPKLDIISFYETQPTSIGLKSTRIMVLEKDSSVLGYPGETSKALDADHHGVCKYDSPSDPNYIIVRNVLQSLVSKVISTDRSKKLLASSRRESHDLKSTLAITELPDVDYIFYRDQWTPGTSEWILNDQTYLIWRYTQVTTPHILWLKGGPATGKSVLSSFIINDLVEHGVCCQYFFIRFGDRKKRTLSLLLRSIAYQIAQSVPDFSQRVNELVDEAIDFETADPKTIWEYIFKSVLFKTGDHCKPLYWIIDGIDEADDTRAVIKLLSDISLSPVPIRILLVGRETSEITNALRKIPSSITLSDVSIEGHLEDLRCYIQQELEILGTVDFKANVVQQILERSQNNFLWVRLAVQKLNSCRTHADVEHALSELPSGMNSIYDRMATSVVQNHSSVGRTLASTILQCVSCSFRMMTVVELSQAINDDISGLLDLHQSIVDLCGGFVVIDNGGNVAMVHQTAREYLLSNDERPFRVDREAAHRQVFLSCMRCLMSAGLRGKLNRNSKPEFLDYGATWWSSHLLHTSPTNKQVTETLFKFLAGHWILIWIHVLAASEHLRILVQASEHLLIYSAKSKKHSTVQNDQVDRVIQQHLIESWAVDCVKIVGKFGSSLRRSPESIYKLIPPFCPQNSAIYQQFGKIEARTLMVSGYSTENWDDSLARLSLGFGTYASAISAAGAQIAVLATSGIVSIFDSSTFEETVASPIRHGERVYRMELNTIGTLLVTHGFKTLKLWDVNSGRCKLTVENVDSRPRPLTMLITNNNTSLIVGADDRRIRSLNLTESSPTWQHVAELEELELEGHFLNSSSNMALNNDGSMIAVAYRGHPLSAWETDGPVHIGHCWRQRKELARGEVIDLVWHPYSPEVFGLYIEGVVFKWLPYESEVNELVTGASRLAISKDGNLFATGDVHGIVKVYTTFDFSLLYHLASQDSVLSLTFSPDSRRLYDIRGDYGNAWSPNTLMRFADHTRKKITDDSETVSLAQSATISVSYGQKIRSITVLTGSPRGRFYCCGTEYGNVGLFDKHQNKTLDLHVSKSFLSIEQMTWSGNGEYVCFSDSSKKVFITSIIAATPDSEVAVRTQAEISIKSHAEGAILQLLFHPNSRSLLVYTSSAICTISLESNSVTKSLEWYTNRCRWVAHPRDPSLILGLGPNRIHVLNWDLAELRTCKFEMPVSQDGQTALESPSDESTVDRVLVTQDKKYMLVQVSSSAQHSRKKTFLYFETSTFSNPKSADSDSGLRDATMATRMLLPRSITSQVAVALSFLSQNRLIFLSTNFTICSWQLPFSSGPSLPSSPPRLPSDSIITALSSGRNDLDRRHSYNVDKIPESMVKELFLLPGDWIGRDCLALCCIWSAEKSLMVPRNGEVAIVRSAALG